MKYFFLKKIPLRFYIYLFISLAYLSFMKNNSPLGISWTEGFTRRIVNSVDNILNNSYLLKYGLTSRINLIEDQRESFFVYPFYYYIHFVFIKFCFGLKGLLLFGPILTKLIISTTGIYIAELSRKILSNLKTIPDTFIAIGSYSLFISTPWTYIMYLKPQSEIYFLFFLITSFYYFLKKRIHTGIILYFIACIYQYQWGFFLALFYFILLVLSKIFKDKKSIQKFLAPGISTFKLHMLMIIGGLFPSLLLFLQRIFLSIYEKDIVLKNTSAFFRVGIDSYFNYGHGGWLGALTFLGGARVTECINISEGFRDYLQQKFTLYDLNFYSDIFSYNCALSIFGYSLLSGLSIFSLMIYLNKQKYLWFLIPIIFSLITFLSIFQQTWNVHIRYYSYPFSLLFTIGIIHLFQLIYKKLNTNLILSNIIISPLFFAIIISNVRVSYLIK